MIMNKRSQHSGFGARQDSQQPEAFGRENKNDAKNQESSNAPGQLLSDKGDHRPLRERFNVNTHTGGASFSLPIQTSPGRSGFGPSLELAYDSGAANVNGVFGLGWHLQGIDSISRKTSTGVPLYDDEKDIFVHSAVGDLVPVMQESDNKPVERKVKDGDVGYAVRLYRPRVEGVPTRVERWHCLDGSAHTHWRSVVSGSVTTIFGRDARSRISYSDESRGAGKDELVFSWLPEEMYDGHGNHMVFAYSGEDEDSLTQRVGSSLCEAHRSPTSRSTQRYLKSIKYGNIRPNRDPAEWKVYPAPADDPLYWMFEVVFDYGDHPEEFPTTRGNTDSLPLRQDPFSTHTSGFEIRTYRLCHRVLMFHHFPELKKTPDCLVAATMLHYETNPRSGASILTSHTMCGCDVDNNGDYTSSQMPSTTFEYGGAPELGNLRCEEIDMDISGLSTPAAQWVDLDGDGIPGVLSEVPGGGWYYSRNMSHDKATDGDPAKPIFGGPTLVAQIPSLANSNLWTFEDLTGNGQMDVVFRSPSNQIYGFYERSDEGALVSFTPLVNFPSTYSPADPTWQKIDLDGDGHPDLLDLKVRANNELGWYALLGRQGYSAAKSTKGAPMLPRGGTSHVMFCDMNGDGLSDILLVNHSHICYWPNHGHGQFGSKVIMENPPFLAGLYSFTPLRIRTADVTGSGTADLIYLPPEGGAWVYYNHSGNGWSDVDIIPQFPPLDRFCAVSVFDIVGRGTECLCWTSDHLNPGSTKVRFLDLMGGSKPGLVTKCSNGTGAQVEVAYRASTQYRLDSERAGHPWATRLPFPVHCVERTISTDLIAKTSSTTRYAYHNGYYDYEERQFAGFQMVDEWETEDLSISQKTKLQRPPVHTKNWFYIGLESLDEGKPWGDYYAVGQDWQTPLRSTLCTDRGLENTMTPQEVRDAYRALSGHTRRQEIFSPDGSSRAGIPYVVTDHAYDAVMQQGTRQIQRYGIFRVNSREQVAFQLERQRNEPRIQHTFTLQTDFYGNVCKQAVVNYGKRESSLPKESDRCAQEETVIQYTETDYTNEIDPFLNSAQLDTVSAQPNPTTFDYFQAPLPCEVRNYRVFPGDASEEQRCNGKFTSQDLERLIAEAREIPVSRERNVSATDTEKILLGQQRTLYCEENLRGPKRVGELDARSIEYQSYQLAVTRSMLEEILKNQQSPLPESFDLIGEARRGGYVAIDDSDTWWIPSSRMLFREKSDSATSTNSLAAAQAHFYIADGEVDPFGSISSHRFDRYWFLTESSIDAVGNEIIFENEYLHLQPKAITDANKNRVESVSDAIGRNVGVAMVGKPGKDKGDSLEGFNVVISPEQLAKFIQDPAGDSARQLLGNAGHRVISNDYYTQEGEVFIPPFRAQLARDTHYQSTTASQISVSITYLNGNGEAIQTVSLSVDIKGVRKWAVSSAIQDSKGEVARQFLPVYSSNHRFKFPFEGPATTVLRDGVNRVVGTLQPDQLWTKTRTTPWFSKTYDTGDTIGIQDPAEDEDVGYYFKLMDRKEYFPTWYTQKSSSESDVERKAATNAEVYKSTPTTTHLDSLGQHIMTTLDNGIQGGRPDTRYARTEYDLRGNVHILRDALDRIVTKARYDLLGRPLHSVNLDSGHRWIFSDCDGALLLSWSGRRCRRRVFYDAMRRVQKLTVASGEEVEKTVVANVYGDDRNALPHLEAFDNNLKGKLYECRDQSGKQTNHQFDFKGNCVRSSLQHAAEYKKIVDWSYGNELESTIYTTTQSFDALGHVVQSTAKDDDQETCEVIRTYDVAGRVKSIIGSPGNDGPRASIENIEYSADGNVTRIEHGDNSFTTHSYNPKTRKLTNTVTQRSDPRSCLQNVSYVYDCTGRVIFEDRHHQYAFHANTAVTPSPEFTYNAIGQLTSATGREQVTGSEKQLRVYDSCSRANRGSRNEGEMVGYVERYHYDKVGNMEKMEHQPKTKTYTGWTREFSYNESSCVEPTRGVYSNRLSKTTLTGSSYEGYKYNDVGPSDSRRDEYDTNGCMTKMPGYPAMTWDYNDQLRTVSTQRVRGDATPAITWYVYNAQGERARKITECGTSAKDASTPTKMKETRYLPLHDIYTKYAQRGTVKVREVTSCGISDPALGRSPTIMIETTRKYTRSGIEQQHLLRYQISDRLEVDDQSNVVSYEEFSPYGVSTYQSRNTDAPRKYRFAGYQRDSESGFYLCGARYYMPWLGRWSAPDPLGTVDGMNLYNYAGSDPVNWEDHRGTSKTRKAPSRRKDSVISGRITRRGDQPRMRSYPSYMQKRIRNVVESAIAHFSQPGNRAINSHYNPSKLADNCSYVTRAYLQGNGRGARQLITANDLSGEYDRQGLRGLTEIRERLQDDPGSYGRQFSTENRWKSAPKFINKGIREYRIGACSWPREVGVVYRRPDGSGHVVVGKNIGKPYRRYVDYQRDKFGEDVTKDVMKSRIHMLFDYRNR